MYSELAWEGFARFFAVLEKLRLTRFYSWNPRDREFIQNPSPTRILYAFSNSVILFQFVCIPVYIFLEKVVSSYDRPFTTPDATVAILVFAAGLHSFPIYLMQLTARHDLSVAFNALIKTERFVRNNQMFKRPVQEEGPSPSGTKKKLNIRLDIMGIVLNLIGPIFFSFPFAGPIIVYLDLDPIYHVLPKDMVDTLWALLFRNFMVTVAILELAMTLGMTHFTFLTLTMHCNWLLGSIRTYIKPKRYQNESSSNEGGNTKRFPKIKAWKKVTRNIIGETRTSKYGILETLEDTNLYYMISYTFRVVRQYMNTAIIFTIGPGFLIDVVCNYAAIKLHDDLPIYLYAYFCLIAFLAPCIIIGELPQAGKSFDNSSELLRYWKGTARKSYRRKYVNGLNVVGYSVGDYFMIKRSTLGTFMDQLSNYTISAILTVG